MSQNNQTSAGNFQRVMIVNDTPGEECRIAILDQGRLDGLSAERVATATNVGNIYKGKVTNVEPAIQAAFVDFGEGQNGFLHISDLHPQYFPSGDKTEKVGKKVPRKSRPLMQEALKRGSEILVQVLKEGLGTKGPTLTSYLSIPGRLLVMMPGMDKVGVSRKVEDEAQRKEMRRILDSLNLPEGFGFILRTAGFTATKTELSRDAAYLTRLWKVMEKRMGSVGAPCELYTESDLLLRTLRDVLDTSISAIVVDSESALARASTFLSVIAPRSSPPVRFYGGKAPIFHAFDVERQIELIHVREVPLPSGGALVFDQTEALVAIDVNSGKSRSARDSETNAYRTNCEAAEEICRQLRLRDLGGLVVCDMIDMRSHKHRKDIQDRFDTAFKKDRARTTVLPVSDFGIVEITRQRMRPSLRKTHYAECPSCAGHGEIRLPDSVAADALRRVGSLFAHERIRRIELVVPVRVASSLLSSRRQQLMRLERSFDKRIDVRISEALGLDRFDVYAYDDRNADVEIDRLPTLPMPSIGDLPTAAPTTIEDHDDEETFEDAGGRRRRRRRRKPGPADAAAIALAGGFEPDDFEAEVAAIAGGAADSEDAEDDADAEAAESGEGEGGRKRRRRRRRRGRGRGAGEAAPSEESEAGDEVDADAEPAAAPVPVDEGPVRVHVLAKEYGLTSKELVERCAAEGIEGVRAAMSSVSGESLAKIRGWFAPPPPAVVKRAVASTVAASASDADSAEAAEGEPRKKRRRRRRRRRGGGSGEPPVIETMATEAGDGSESADDEDEDDHDPDAAPSEIESPEGETTPADAEETDSDSDSTDGGPRKKRRRRRGGRGRSKGEQGETREGETDSQAGEPSPAAASAPAAAPAAEPVAAAAPASPKARSLYGGGRTRKISPAALRNVDR